MRLPNCTATQVASKVAAIVLLIIGAILTSLLTLLAMLIWCAPYGDLFATSLEKFAHFHKLKSLTLLFCKHHCGHFDVLLS